jgi:hypothetical protein
MEIGGVACCDNIPRPLILPMGDGNSKTLSGILFENG